MNKILFTKDIRLLLKDLKFQLFFLITVLLFILSAVSSAVTYQNLSNEYQNLLGEHSTRINDERSTQLVNLLSGKPIIIIDPPSPAVLFSSYENYPNYATNEVAHFNPLFHQYKVSGSEVFRLNWFFIIGIMSGLFMLLISFEAISNEKRAGTLRLISIFGYKRQTFLWSKYFSYLFLYLIIIIPPALISLLLFFALTSLWQLSYMLQYLLILLLSIPFASFFIWLGILISMSRNYRSSIITVVFLWLLFVVIIPATANIMGRKITPIKSNLEYEQKHEAARLAEWEQWRDQVWIEALPGLMISNNDNDISYLAGIASVEKRNQSELLQHLDSRNQTQTIQKIASLSPFIQLEKLSEIIFIKGQYLFDFLYDNTRMVQSQVRNLMIEQDLRDEFSEHRFSRGYNTSFYEPWGDNLPSFSMQKFEHPDLLFVASIQTDEIAVKIKKVLFNLLPIFGLNILLLFICVLRIEKMDIR